MKEDNSDSDEKEGKSPISQSPYNKLNNNNIYNIFDQARDLSKNRENKNKSPNAVKELMSDYYTNYIDDKSVKSNTHTTSNTNSQQKGNTKKDLDINLMKKIGLMKEDINIKSDKKKYNFINF